MADQVQGGGGEQDPNPAPTPTPNPAPASPSPSGSLPTKPGETSGATPPAKPAEDGGASNKSKASVYEGVDPKLIHAIKQSLTKEVKASVTADLEREQAQRDGKWEELYNKAKPQLDRVPELEAELETYRTLVSTTLDNRIKDWPKEWLNGDPRKRNPAAPLEDVVAWMDWAEPLVQAQTGGGQKPPTNVNSGAPANAGASGGGGGQGQGGGGQAPRGGQPNAADVPAGWTKDEWEKHKISRKQNYGLSV